MSEAETEFRNGDRVAFMVTSQGYATGLGYVHGTPQNGLVDVDLDRYGFRTVSVNDLKLILRRGADLEIDGRD